MHIPHGGSEDTWRRQSSIDEVYRRRLSTISRPHAGDRFWSKCAMVCCTGCMSCWAIVYLPAGIVLMCQTSVMDPKNDFAHFPLGCKITDETHFDMDSRGQCIDRYTYSFVVKPPHAEAVVVKIDSRAPSSPFTTQNGGCFVWRMTKYCFSLTSV